MNISIWMIRWSSLFKWVHLWSLWVNSVFCYAEGNCGQTAVHSCCCSTLLTLHHYKAIFQYPSAIFCPPSVSCRSLFIFFCSIDPGMLFFLFASTSYHCHLHLCKLAFIWTVCHLKLRWDSWSSFSSSQTWWLMKKSNCLGSTLTKMFTPRPHFCPKAGCTIGVWTSKQVQWLIIGFQVSQ